MSRRRRRMRRSSFVPCVHQIDDWHWLGYRCRDSQAEQTVHLCRRRKGGLRHFHLKVKGGVNAAEGSWGQSRSKDHQWSSCSHSPVSFVGFRLSCTCFAANSKGLNPLCPWLLPNHYVTLVISIIKADAVFHEMELSFLENNKLPVIGLNEQWSAIILLYFISTFLNSFIQTAGGNLENIVMGVFDTGSTP